MENILTEVEEYYLHQHEQGDPIPLDVAARLMEKGIILD